MKKRGVQRKNSINNERDFFKYFICGWLLVFIFSRCLVDGLTYPYFNYFWNISFFILVITYFIRERYNVSISKEELLLYLFFLFSVISAGFSKIQETGIEFISQILGYWCFIFLFVRVFSKKHSFIIWNVILISSFIVVLYGIHQYFGGFEATRKYLYSSPEIIKTLPPTYLERLSSNRVFSTFVYPNIFAGFLIMIFPFSFFITLSKKKKYSIPAFFLIILIVYTLFLTGSIGGIAIFLFILQIMLLYFLFNEKKLWISITILSTVEILALIFLYKRGMLPHMSSFQDRLMYWKSSIQIFKNNFLCGVGPENYKYFYLTFKSPGSMEAKHAHNLFFETLSETGIIGTMLLFGVFGLFIKRIIKFAGENKKNLFIGGIIFSFLAGFLHNLVDFDFIDPAVTLYLFLFIGWGLMYLKEKYPPNIKLTKTLSYLIICTIFLTGFLCFRYGFAKKYLKKSFLTSTYREKLYLLDRAEKYYLLSETSCEKGKLYFVMAMKTGEKTYFEKSERAFREAVRINPFMPKLYRNLAFLYEEKGNYLLAEKMYNNLLNVYPTKKQFNLETALFYKKHGREERFRYFYEKSKKFQAITKEESEIIKIYEKWITDKQLSGFQE